MPQQREVPPGQTAELGDVSSIVFGDAPSFAPNADVAQAKIDLLVDDIGCNLGALSATLHTAIAMREASDSVGLIYALRRSGAYWAAISGSARELVAAEAERQSAIRQEGAAP